jgi:AcrR family transcriptional regulator
VVIRRQALGRRVADVEGTREALLRAGTEVFAELGFEGATTEKIAKRAGANKAMINYHFRSKQALYSAILEDTFNHIGTALAAVRASQKSAPDQLREFVAAFVGAATARPSFPAMMLREVVGGGRHLTAEAQGRFLQIAGVIAGIVEQGAREGSLRPVDPLLTHLSVVAPMVVFLATAPFRERMARQAGFPFDPPSQETFVSHMQELLIRGLAAEPAAQKRS